MENEIDVRTCSINQLLPCLFQLQSQRCLTYQRLADAHNMFFQTHNFPAFQSFLSDITIIFARISDEILAIKQRFHMKTLIMKHIEQLQDDEEKKLRWTNELFVAQIEKKIDDIECKRRRLTELVDHINEILDELRYDQEEQLVDIELNTQ
jgi:hypothetical protein